MPLFGNMNAHALENSGNIGILEIKMETTIVCWDNIGIMEKKMETTKPQTLNPKTLKP